VRSLLAGGAVLSLGAVGRSLTASAGTACPALPEETSGPFPADGSKQGARLLEATTRVLTTQLTAPREVCTRVYAEAPGYARSAAQFKGLLPGDDMVFAASSRAELALQTLVITGGVGAGFTGRAALGIRA